MSNDANFRMKFLRVFDQNEGGELITVVLLFIIGMFCIGFNEQLAESEEFTLFVAVAAGSCIVVPLLLLAIDFAIRGCTTWLTRGRKNGKYVVPRILFGKKYHPDHMGETDHYCYPMVISSLIFFQVGVAIYAQPMFIGIAVGCAIILIGCAYLLRTMFDAHFGPKEREE